MSLGKLIGKTFPIIKSRVGEDGQKKGDDVKRINQLLKLAGYLKGFSDESVWSKTSAKALEDFYSRHKGLTRYTAPFIEPKDNFDFLCTLAFEAGVLIALPTGMRSASALKVFFDTCVAKRYKYGWVKKGVTYNGGTKTIWGFEGRKGWAISTVGINGKYFFDQTYPITLNCTGFANLALSVWITGCAHEGLYDASQMVGATYPLGWRYNLQGVNDNNLIFDGYCFDTEAVLKCMSPNRLYHLGLCEKDDGMITHDVVAFNGETYECNLTQTPAVYKTKAQDRINKVLRNKGCVRILGPAPL